jgi:hypothetical protein
MQGFFISATASLLGSALVFVVLRRLFSKRLNAWSSKSNNWQALESVVVSYIISIGFELSSNSETILIESERFTINDPDSHFTLSAVGLFQCSICGKSSFFFPKSSLTITTILVHTNGTVMAICHCNPFHFSETPAPHIHRDKDGFPSRWRPA